MGEQRTPGVVTEDNRLIRTRSGGRGTDEQIEMQ